jgi:hypothetical protein
MCAVSMAGDFYRDKWNQTPHPFPTPLPLYTLPPPPVTREEFDQLKREVLDMKELLKRAKKYDEDNGEPNCEIEDKMDFLRKVAALVGVNLDDVIGKKA